VNALTPLFEQAIADLQKKREADAVAKEEARRAAVSRRPVASASGSSPIEKFNAAHRIEDLMLKYGYEAASNGHGWQSPLQQSGSFATRIFCNDDGTEHWVSLSQSDAEAGLGRLSASGARFGDAFDMYVFYEHNGHSNAALLACEAEEAKRRQAQREENAQIGSGPDAIPRTEVLSAERMLERFVFVREGSQVADLDNPLSVLPWGDFKNAHAGSKHQVATATGATKPVPATLVWLESSKRKQADTLTFHAGAGLMTRCPSGREALNIWRPRDRTQTPDNWEWRASYFVDHVARLWGADAEPFLDWLAHIEQKPGELPHFSWLHISPLHGTGRNWIAGVSSRLWPGNVAASLDLVGLLEGGFNDRLSRCLLGIVDEVNEGGTQKYRTANRLRQMVTPEFREINPKYGRKRVEHNAARWLIFSNHTGALPLDENDRRFWVVHHEAQPREASYYVRLYGLLRDPLFIASVAQFLRRRDISQFNPGQRPPMNDAKEALVEFNQSEDDVVCKALVARWPVDLITRSELNTELPLFSNVTKPTVRHAMDHAGIKKIPDRKVRFGEVTEIIYMLRNCQKWSRANPDQIRTEINRASKSEKTIAMGGYEDE
jgi:hypothetical protein